MKKTQRGKSGWSWWNPDCETKQIGEVQIEGDEKREVKIVSVQCRGQVSKERLGNELKICFGIMIPSKAFLSFRRREDFTVSYWGFHLPSFPKLRWRGLQRNRGTNDAKADFPFGWTRYWGWLIASREFFVLRFPFLVFWRRKRKEMSGQTNFDENTTSKLTWRVFGHTHTTSSRVGRRHSKERNGGDTCLLLFLSCCSFPSPKVETMRSIRQSILLDHRFCCT